MLDGCCVAVAGDRACAQGFCGTDRLTDNDPRHAEVEGASAEPRHLVQPCIVWPYGENKRANGAEPLTGSTNGINWATNGSAVVRGLPAAGATPILAR